MFGAALLTPLLFHSCVGVGKRVQGRGNVKWSHEAGTEGGREGCESKGRDARVRGGSKGARRGSLEMQTERCSGHSKSKIKLWLHMLATLDSTFDMCLGKKRGELISKLWRK